MKFPSCILCVLLAFAATMPAQKQERSLHCSGPGCAGMESLSAASPEQLSAHPWLLDKQLPSRVGHYSKELEQVLLSEQRLLASRWGPEFRSGSNQLFVGDAGSAYKWELILHKSADEYRIKRAKDEAESRILLSDSTWTIYAGDGYTKLVAQGGIETISPPNTR